MEKNEARSIAQQALAETPTYVEHISQMFSDCVIRFRQGDDRTGLTTFARGMSDLNQFIQLLFRVAYEAGAPSAGHSEEFQQELAACINQMQDSLVKQDIVALSDGIEGGLLPLLSQWTPVAEELNQGLIQAAPPVQEACSG